MSTQPIPLNALPAADSADGPAAPFVGLRPFESTESVLFFGRREQTAELLQLLDRERFLAVVGSSGCGKSSLIRAGLIPKLKANFILGDSDHWRFVKMRPGDSPLANLAAALLSEFGGEPEPGPVAELVEEIRVRGGRAVTARLDSLMRDRVANVLLLVDQFEEIFRYGDYDDEAEVEAARKPGERDRRRDEAAEFVSVMLALAEQAALPVYVVLTMRSDFLGDCDVFYGLPQAMNRSQYLVPRLDRRQRLEAIESPVRLYGGTVAPRLLDRVLNDMGEESDQLPVMQHVMLRTWERWALRREGPVDLKHYEHEEVGGIKKALSLDADSALEGMDDGQLLITKRMFQALTKTDAKGRRLRRPAHLSEIVAITGADRQTVLDIIERFRGQRRRSFLTLSEDKLRGDTLVDISHESLIRQWGTLGEWVTEENESRDQYLRLASAAVLHFDPERPKVGLWRDPELKEALDWWEKRQPNRAWARRYHPRFTLAKGFLRLSAKKRADEEAAAEAARLAKEQAKQEEHEKEKALAEERRRQAEDLAASRKRELEAAEEAAAARERELVAAQELAREQQVAAARQRRYLIAFAVLAAVMLGLSILSGIMWSRAQQSKDEADAALRRSELLAEQLQESLKSESGLKQQAEQREAEAQAAKDEANRQAMLADEQRQLALQKAAEAEQERSRTAAANQKIQQQLNDVRTANAKAVGAQDAGVMFRQALKSQRESAIDRAATEYKGAIAKYKEINDEPAQLDTKAELGKMLLNRQEASLVEVVPGGDFPELNASPTPTPDPKVIEEERIRQQQMLSGEIVPHLVKGVLGPDPRQAAEVSGTILPALDVSKGQAEGLTYYADVISAYRAKGDHMGAGSLLDEIGEFFSPSVPPRDEDNTLPLPKSSLITPRKVGREQAAILFFCQAADEFRGRNHLSESVALLKIATRLSQREATRTVNPGDGPSQRVAKSLELVGCAPGDSASVGYFDRAVRAYELSVTNPTDSPEAAQKRSEAAPSLLFQIGALNLGRTRPDVADRYFKRALELHGDSPQRRKSFANLLAKIGNLYLSRYEFDLAKGYYDKLAALDTKGLPPEDSEYIASLLYSAGIQYPLGTKEVDTIGRYFKAANTAYESAVAAYQLAGENKKAAQLLVNLAGRMESAEPARAYYLRAIEEYKKKGLFNEAAGVRLNEMRRAVTEQLVSAKPDERQKLYELLITDAEEARALYEKAQNAGGQADALIIEGDTFVEMGQPDKADEALKKAGGLVKETDKERRGDLNMALGRLSLFHMRRAVQQGSAAEARRHRADAERFYKEALARYKESNSPFGRENASDALESLPPADFIDQTPTPTPTPTPVGVGEIDVDGQLGGPAIEGQTPKGTATYRVHRDGERNFKVSVKDVNLPRATLHVFVNGTLVGDMQVGDDNEGKFKLDTDDDEDVPLLGGAQARVEVKDGDGTTILSGVLNITQPPQQGPPQQLRRRGGPG